ncbi:LysE family translocator [Bacillus sp. FJAT-45350]|uniref:LysE family translocator n=1 Tax=Bacillus sp. FJAT-45350 TaxID=2011014 RepID=UPI000BB76B7F|nr:LysE family translocator [Bacillus sp. FJAT-45350]
MDIMLLASFLGVAIALTLLPGPDILFVMAQSIAQNKKAGIATALGLCSGLVVHITAATVGITAILYQSAIAFTLVKYAGAIYLFYLAWKSFTDKENALTMGKNQALQYKALYKKGIIMNLLNPKVSLVFLSLLPQFVNHTAGYVPLQMALLGGLFLIQALFIFSLVSIFSEKVQQFLVKSTTLTKRLNVIQGSIFVLIGIQITFSKG